VCIGAGVATVAAAALGVLGIEAGVGSLVTNALEPWCLRGGMQGAVVASQKRQAHLTLLLGSVDLLPTAVHQRKAAHVVP
jgi:hypothetical protein